MKRVLEKKFNPIGFLDSVALIKELQNYNSVSDKLDYLKSIKERYYDKFQSVIGNLSKDEEIYFYTGNNRTQFWESVFGNYSLITPLKIQEPVFERYFKNGLNNPEFTYWFLKYNYDQAFNLHINSEEFRSQVNSDLKTTFIEAELKQLNDFETKAKNLLLNKDLDIYRPHPNNYKYTKEIVLLRVLEGNYYKENTLSAISNFGDEVQAYYKYKLLKPYLVSKQNELPPKIKALFQFIEFLHLNIENFNQYNDLIKALELLVKERNRLSQKNTYKDKLQYDKVQAELENKFKLLQDKTANLIKAKAKELDVCNFNNEPNYSFNGVEIEILQLKENFSPKDLAEIFKHKTLYLEYRSQTHKTFLSLQIFFEDLDEIAKSLFEYFKDTKRNEFEAFETKAIPVNNIAEALQGFKQGQTKFIIPSLMNETKASMSNSLADFSFFQIEVIAALEFEGKTYKDIQQKNNDSILTPENWEQHKETFFAQRMATYKESYTIEEKLKLELSALEKLPINKTDYQILKDRYKQYLKQKQALPPQQNTKDELDENSEPNNLTNSTIEDWLFEFKERKVLNEPHYTNLVNALNHYFENGEFPKLDTTIKFGRVNKKLLGWHLNRIFHSEGKGVENDLLSFAKANISTFKDVEFNEQDIQNCNLYKYFTTKTK